MRAKTEEGVGVTSSLEEKHRNDRNVARLEVHRGHSTRLGFYYEGYQEPLKNCNLNPLTLLHC